ncbi:ABC transporter permease family protein [Schlesneria paludicola]|uniref:hypothetical protein n=1 Tax=Schlesneria paludicola TaxID=360056 RepID=UPI00029AF71B|nr:hypothetical protein [Schlesneria paludicola]
MVWFTSGFSWLSLPLLSKDLIEQSNQRRTYVYRALFALALYGGGLWIYFHFLSEGISQLGHGTVVLTRLLWFQVGVTVTIVPLLASGALAGEKERETLDLLLTTKLSPQTIVIEKFGAHFISIASLQLLALPLMALAYAMGGVDLVDVLDAIVKLMCMAEISVAWAIICSSWAYTTNGALLGYLSLAPLWIMLLIPAGPLQQTILPIFALYGCALLTTGLILGAQLLEKFNEPREAPEDPEGEPDEVVVTVNLRKLSSYYPIFFQIFVMVMSVVVTRSPRLGPVLMLCCTTVCTLFLLVRAGPAILMVRMRRPGERHRSEVLLAVEAAVDEVNSLTLTGTTLGRAVQTVSGERPVEWRELHRLIYRVRTLLWCVIFIMSVLGLIIYWGLASGASRDDFELMWSTVEIILWGSAVGSLSFYAANLFPTERAQQTLDVLLVTPLSSKEIVDQKLAGARRMILAWSFPLIGMWLVRVGLLNRSLLRATPVTSIPWWMVMFTGSVGIVLLPRLITWLGVYCGLRASSRSVALISTISVVSAIFLAPWLLVVVQQSGWLWLCPLVPFSPELWSASFGADSSWGALSLRLVTSLVLLCGLRFAVYRQFSRLVGRLDAS